jgi:hypothetical protein
MRPDVAEGELLSIFRSAEVRSVGSPTDQIPFLQIEPHTFTLQMIATLFHEHLTTAHKRLKPLRFLEEAADGGSGNAADFSGSHFRPTCSEELNIIGWIEARQQQYDCP